METPYFRVENKALYLLFDNGSMNLIWVTVKVLKPKPVYTKFIVFTQPTLELFIGRKMQGTL